MDDGQVVKIVQVGETAVGTRKASSTASSMLFCGKTNESKTNEFSMSFEVELTTVTEAEHVERIFLELCQDAVANRDGVDVDEARHRLDGGEAILDGGHSGDAREVDERRSGPHRRERESDSRQSL